MKKTIALLLLAVSVVGVAGCSSTAADTVYKPEAQQGVVDKSLPSALRDKQQSLFLLLNALKEGIGESVALRAFVPGVEFRESFEKFYDGSKRLVRWEFGGSPSGNDVPVVLYFDSQESGPVDPGKLLRSERTYVVTGSGQQVTIARK
jgi:hypothetical protein